MHLFYPSHDIALAHGVKHFNPPAAALRLQEDLAYLYEIWNQPFLHHETTIPIPWGWDWDTRDLICRGYGVKRSQLPTDEDLEQIRQLSNRRTSIQLLEKLAEKTQLWPKEFRKVVDLTLPKYLDTEDKLWQFITEHDAAGKPFVLKTPWSSSGRGLHVSRTRTQNGLVVDNSRTILMKQALGTIHKMGGILGEEWIDRKAQDFAMLFYASSKEVRFIGYSLFDNDESANGTTYRQGYLLSNEKIMKRLSLPLEILSSIAQAYEEILTEMLRPFLGKTWHLGYLGIDMMTYYEGANEAKNEVENETENIGGNEAKNIAKNKAKNEPQTTLKLHPCIELNLRCTMGVVCRLWYDQNQREGYFRISPLLSNGHFNADFLPTE